MSSGDPQTRQRILQATRELVEQSRGQSARLEDIAQRAGVSRQAIYLHFGSRVGLLVATVQYVDQTTGFFERTQHVRDAESGLAALHLFIAFWADYVPNIFDLAKVLLTARATDPAAAAAWADRMNGLWNVCHHLTSWIERDGLLAPQWTAETAADMLWMVISIQAWENLVVEKGWSKANYIERLQHMLRRALTTGEAPGSGIS
jgi:AcrR family transcriptional regulator